MGNIQNSDARKLAEEWERKKASDPEAKCSHPTTSKEYYLGSATGDHICDTCGSVVFK